MVRKTLSNTRLPAWASGVHLVRRAVGFAAGPKPSRAGQQQKRQQNTRAFHALAAGGSHPCMQEMPRRACASKVHVTCHSFCLPGAGHMQWQHTLFLFCILTLGCRRAASK